MPLPRALAGYFALSCLLKSAVGCGSDAQFTSSANVAGNYTITVTNADNGCMLDNWVVGDSNNDIPFLVEQQDGSLTGTLQGLAGLALASGIGTNKFQGSSVSNGFDMTAFGTLPHMAGSCTYLLNAVVDGEITGDAISGTIKYAHAASDNPDCASVQCSSTQNFNGTRPPSAK